MAIKTFSAGEILTAADTNSYLNNGGLVYLKEQNVGSAVTSVTVTDAFNSGYRNYKIIYSGGVLSATNTIHLRFGIGVTMTTTNYSGAAFFVTATTNTLGSLSDNAAAQASYAGGGGTNGTYVNIDVLNPQLATYTAFHGVFNQDPNSRYGSCSYEQRSTTQFTSFNLSASAGTMSGGTIYVYGYRKV
jgi:hypothetical protein